MLAVAGLRPGRAAASVEDIDGRPVAVFRIDGALGEHEGDVISRLVITAAATGIPVWGTVASLAPEVCRGPASLAAMGGVARTLAGASGVVPIVLLVEGRCASGPALLLGLADIVVATDDALAFVSGPPAVRQVTGLAIHEDTLGGLDALNRSGVVALVGDADTARDVLSYLPSNNLETPPVRWCADPADRDCDSAAGAVPESPSASYDVRDVASDVVDDSSLLELWARFGPSIVTALATVEAQPVGVVANQPGHLAGTIDIDASQKAARFVQLCDAFNVPLVTLVDTPGFQPGKDLEWRGMIRHGAQLVHAYARATVPRVCVVLRKAYGGAFIVMDSKGMGNDACFAWPGAEVAVMGAAGAIQVLHRGVDPAERARLEAEYAASHCTPAVAAERGYVDDVIAPRDTRRVVAMALRVLRSKREELPRRRHSNIPL